MQFQAGNGHRMRAGQNLWQPFVAAGEVVAAEDPGKPMFDQPASERTAFRATAQQADNSASGRPGW